MSSDRIAEERDWKDGINQFRLKMLEELKEINEKLEKLQQTKENPNEPIFTDKKSAIRL